VNGGRSSKIEPIGLWFLRVLKWKTAREVKRTSCKAKAITKKQRKLRKVYQFFLELVLRKP
jgi:hypothetical protein